MNMFKAAAVTLALSASFAVLAGQGIYGSWKMPSVVAGPLTIESYLTVAAGSVTAHSTCSMDGKTASVEVSSPATITDSQLTILGSAQNSVDKDGVNCHASVQPGSVSYQVSADDQSLALTIPGQGTLTLPRK